jgi:hypothetical protein
MFLRPHLIKIAVLLFCVFHDFLLFESEPPAAADGSDLNKNGKIQVIVGK